MIYIYLLTEVAEGFNVSREHFKGRTARVHIRWLEAQNAFIGTQGQSKTRQGLCVQIFNSHVCYSFMHLREEPGSLSAEKIPKGISLSETPIKLQQHSSSPIYFPHRATHIFSLKLPLSLSLLKILIINCEILIQSLMSAAG